MVQALNYEEIKNNSPRAIKIEPFIDKCKWEGKSYTSEKEGWKKFETNNLAIVIDVNQ